MRATGKTPGMRSEYGQLIAVDADGRIALMGLPIAGRKDHVSMDQHREILKATDVPGVFSSDERYKVIGIVHTHPATNNFSGADIAEFVNHKEDRVGFVVGEKNVYMLLKTAQTNRDSIFRQPEKWNGILAGKIAALRKQGESYEVAHTFAVKQCADELGVSLYVYDNDRFRKVNLK